MTAWGARENNGMRYPRRGWMLVAAGFQKWGMTSATIAATVLADRLAGRQNPYADMFDPNRITVRSAP